MLSGCASWSRRPSERRCTNCATIIQPWAIIWPRASPPGRSARTPPIRPPHLPGSCKALLDVRAVCRLPAHCADMGHALPLCSGTVGHMPALGAAGIGRGNASLSSNPQKKTALNRKTYAEEEIMNTRYASTNWTRMTRFQLSTRTSHAQAARPHDGGAEDEQLASPDLKTNHQARSAHHA